ncbi:MAG: rod shape-determining protein MreC [Thiomargarita sp.]|nr:rod shape-determining protein MreC [Thiomargarita sp.]
MMNSSLSEERTLNIRVFIFCLISLALMLVNRYSSYLEIVRTHLLTLVYPIHYIVDLPVETSNWLYDNIQHRSQLLSENTKLKEHNLRLSIQLQKFEALQNENQRLRQLLNSPVLKSNQRIEVAKIMAINLETSKREIIINKGKNDGVFINQPVMDAHGIIGQVIQVSLFSSIVMLITDTRHELPVEILRSGLRIVAKGMGNINQLSLLYIPNLELNIKIKVNDLVVTSGFGQKFPQNYPVAIISEVIADIGKPYAKVQAIPKASLEYNREVLLIWK